MDYSIYVARQPIFDRKGEIFAYELLYRNTKNNYAVVDDNLHATSRVLVNTLNYIGLNTLTNGHVAFIKVDDKILFDDIINAIAPSYFVLEILESSVITPDLIKQIHTLHARGHHFALSHYHHDDDFIPRFHSLLDVIEYIKIDINLSDDPAKIIADFAGYRCKFIAEKIEDKESFERAVSYGFNYFQGYYFYRPDLLIKENFDPDNSLLMDLIYLLKRQAPLDELYKKFDTSPYLTINLLKFIQLNGVILHGSISSIEQALLLIGRERLSYWLELMFYANGDDRALERNSHVKQVTQQALQRAYLMEELAYNIKKSTHFCDMAYMTGMLSIVEIMFHESYGAFMKQIKIDKDIVSALLHKKGELGRLMELVIAIEKNERRLIGSIILELDISQRDLNKALLNSYRKSSAVL